MKRVIVVATYGWVFTGHLVTHDTNGVRLESACVIRKWGTEHGLGQLALSGPTKGTILDPCGEVVVPTTSTVAVLDAPGWL